MLGNHGGRGKEGHPGNSDFDAHKAEALGFHVEPPDPLTTQLTYIAGDRKIFPDDTLDKQLRALHPQMDEEGLKGLAKRVHSMRYPKPAGDPKEL